MEIHELLHKLNEATTRDRSRDNASPEVKEMDRRTIPVLRQLLLDPQTFATLPEGIRLGPVPIANGVGFDGAMLFGRLAALIARTMCFRLQTPDSPTLPLKTSELVDQVCIDRYCTNLLPHMQCSSWTPELEANCFLRGIEFFYSGVLTGLPDEINSTSKWYVCDVSAARNRLLAPSKDFDLLASYFKLTMQSHSTFGIRITSESDSNTRQTLARHLGRHLQSLNGAWRPLLKRPAPVSDAMACTKRHEVALRTNAERTAICVKTPGELERRAVFNTPSESDLTQKYQRERDSNERFFNEKTALQAFVKKVAQDSFPPPDASMRLKRTTGLTSVACFRNEFNLTDLDMVDEGTDGARNRLLSDANRKEAVPVFTLGTTELDLNVDVNNAEHDLAIGNNLLAESPPPYEKLASECGKLFRTTLGAFRQFKAASQLTALALSYIENPTNAQVRAALTGTPSDLDYVSRGKDNSGYKFKRPDSLDSADYRLGMEKTPTKTKDPLGGSRGRVRGEETTLSGLQGMVGCILRGPTKPGDSVGSGESIEFLKSPIHEQAHVVAQYSYGSAHRIGVVCYGALIFHSSDLYDARVVFAWNLLYYKQSEGSDELIKNMNEVHKRFEDLGWSPVSTAFAPTGMAPMGELTQSNMATMVTKRHQIVTKALLNSTVDEDDARWFEEHFRLSPSDFLAREKARHEEGIREYVPQLMRIEFLRSVDQKIPHTNGWGTLFFNDKMQVEFGEIPGNKSDDTVIGATLKPLQSLGAVDRSFEEIVQNVRVEPTLQYQSNTPTVPSVPLTPDVAMGALWSLVSKMSAVGFLNTDSHLGNVMLRFDGIKWAARLIDYDEKLSMVFRYDDFSNEEGWKPLLVLNALMVAFSLDTDYGRRSLLSVFYNATVSEDSSIRALRRARKQVLQELLLDTRAALRRDKASLSKVQQLLKMTWKGGYYGSGVPESQYSHLFKSKGIQDELVRALYGEEAGDDAAYESSWARALKKLGQIEPKLSQEYAKSELKKGLDALRLSKKKGMGAAIRTPGVDTNTLDLAQWAIRLNLWHRSVDEIRTFSTKFWKDRQSIFDALSKARLYVGEQNEMSSAEAMKLQLTAMNAEQRFIVQRSDQHFSGVFKEFHGPLMSHMTATRDNEFCVIDLMSSWLFEPRKAAPNSNPFWGEPPDVFANEPPSAILGLPTRPVPAS